MGLRCCGCHPGGPEGPTAEGRTGRDQGDGQSRQSASLVGNDPETMPASAWRLWNSTSVVPTGPAGGRVRQAGILRNCLAMRSLSFLVTDSAGKELIFSL